jgi:competence protein ComEA
MRTNALWERFSCVVERMLRMGRAARVRAVTILTESTWGPVLLKAFLLSLGLLTLAWIGRVAVAATPTPPSLSLKVNAVDAGAFAHEPAAPPAPELRAEPVTRIASTASIPAALALTQDAPRGHGPDRASTEHPVYLNDASVEELRRLPGVGPKRAEAIVALRRRIGRFQRVEDLLKVKGIGRSTLRRWRPLLRLDPPPARGARTEQEQPSSAARDAPDASAWP